MSCVIKAAVVVAVQEVVVIRRKGQISPRFDEESVLTYGCRCTVATVPRFAENMQMFGTAWSRGLEPII